MIGHNADIGFRYKLTQLDRLLPDFGAMQCRRYAISRRNDRSPNFAALPDPALICFVTLTRARGDAARCRTTRSTCSSRLGGAAAAGRTMVRSTAGPSADFHFSDFESGRRWSSGGILNIVCGVLAAAAHKVLFKPSRYRTDGRSGRRSVCNVLAIETR